MRDTVFGTFEDDAIPFDGTPYVDVPGGGIFPVHSLADHIKTNPRDGAYVHAFIDERKRAHIVTVIADGYEGCQGKVGLAEVQGY